MEKVIQQLQELPENLQQEAFQYLVDFVSQHTQAETEKTSLEKPVKRQDLFGIWQGEIWMADDFDAPLDDMQEYMQ